MQLQRGGNALERVGQTVGFFELSGLRLRGKDHGDVLEFAAEIADEPGQQHTVAIDAKQGGGHIEGRQAVGQAIGRRGRGKPRGNGCMRRTAARLLLCKPAIELLDQQPGIDGLGHMVVHAGIDKALAFVVVGVRGHRDDRQLRGRPTGADLPGGGHAVHLGHLHVHQHGGIAAARCLDHAAGHCPVLCAVDLQSGIGEQSHGDFSVDLVVFRQQNLKSTQMRCHCGRLAGSRRDALALHLSLIHI